jgi:hypothetical protein
VICFVHMLSRCPDAAQEAPIGVCSQSVASLIAERSQACIVTECHDLPAAGHNAALAQIPPA